jgi:DNA mismatch endonuclease (patch repair protein)
MDRISKKQRSYLMSRIRGKDTTIEVTFRKYLWAMGVRGYRVRGNVPGSPDVYFPKLHFAVFIDGCFWHRCPQCFRKPKSNLRYWNKKIRDNVARDKRKNVELRRRKIRYMHIWEHEIKRDPNGAYRKFLRRYATSKTARNIAK